MSDTPELDWQEDFNHENGRYLCECSNCGKLFNGHKRRVVCKLCHVDGLNITIAAQQKEIGELRGLLSRTTSVIEQNIHNGNLKMNLVAKQLLVDKARKLLGESNG